MKDINSYIIEKLRINKDSNIDNFEDNLEEEIINYFTGKLHYEYKKDYEFNIKPPIASDIICKVIINLHGDILDGNMSNNDFFTFCSFITDHLNTIFKDKKFSYNGELKLKEIDIYVRNQE